MIEHQCENCGYSWKSNCKSAYCPACHYLDEIEEEEDADLLL